MPPRFAYWTIILDNAATAFRARAKEDLLPTLKQLQRTSAGATLRWFQDGRLWDSPEATRAARRAPERAAPRGPQWRPGEQHRDPRARFRAERKRRWRRLRQAAAQKRRRRQGR